MKKFIGELEQASRAGAEREYEMVLAFARTAATGAHGEPEEQRSRLLVRAVPPSGVRLRLAIRPPPTSPYDEGRKRHTRHRRSALPRQFREES